MPGSRTSVLAEPDDYQAALGTDGEVELVVVDRGMFRAQLTQVALPRVRLVAGVEDLARVAFISVPVQLVRISLPVRSGVPLFCDGILSGADEIVIHGPGQRLHERTNGRCRWRAIWFPTRNLVEYGRPMIGAAFADPFGVNRWRPTPKALRQLIRLHEDAIRMSHDRPLVITQTDAMRGLEMDLIATLMECMQGAPIDANTKANDRHTEIMGRFEDILRARPERSPSVADICTLLGVRDRTFRVCCQTHLGMGPRLYMRLRNMHLARRALRRADPGSANISEVAHRFCFNNPGRFAASYRGQFGELPSMTIRRNSPR
jgi:AraC-like DNA-binding protein